MRFLKTKTAQPNKRKHVILTVLVLCAALTAMLTACSQLSDAEKKTAEGLDALKASSAIGTDVMGLRDSLSGDGREDFDEFLAMVRDFDYEISGSEETDGGTSVKVRIKTYGFGSEYLAVWTEYLRNNKAASGADPELKDFYEMLFNRLSDLEEKTYIKDVDIICTEAADTGEWTADIKDNEELQDAIFGGMISEMKALAEE